MALVKSHSNYVLKKHHQNVSDGTIWERDITTIGGYGAYTPGQMPIYSSSNFIITVRNDGKTANQYNKGKWASNSASGDVWTLESISGMTSEADEQNDLKIVLKQDYYDFKDFAYYGSLSEMFRASINDILRRFPGELYLTSENAYYTSGTSINFEKVEDRVQLGDKDTGFVNYVDNPFNIDIHSINKPSDSDPIKFFCNDGYKNYTINDAEITSWKTKNFIKVVKKEKDLDLAYGGDTFYVNYIKPEVLQQYFSRPNNEIWWLQNENGKVSEEGREDYEELVESFLSGDIYKEYIKYDTKYWIEKDGELKPLDDTFYNTYKDAEAKYNELMESASEDESYIIKNGAACGNIECYIFSPNCKGYKFASVTANTTVIEGWVGDNNEMVYLSSEKEGKHIRPKKSFIDKFYNECDNFQKLILDPDTTPKYKSTFSVIMEDSKGYYRKMREFIFPTSYGGYNIDATSYGFNDFTSQLSEIGEFYDERFTDNLYRSMTHEAIKNFDWTYTREFNMGDEEEYIYGGEKIQKALRVFAREFDEILAFINNIKNVGRLTYDERSNTPDYFLIDEVENKGWDTKLVYPYDLTEYSLSDGTELPNSYNENTQLNNINLRREFSQNPTITVDPYAKKHIVKVSGGTYVSDFQDGYFVVCKEEGGEIPSYYRTGSSCSGKGESDGTYAYKSAEDSGTTYVDADGNIRNRMKVFTDDRDYTIMDANNEFLRRLAINSSYIWRHKGTVEGIEMILGMFGMKSVNWWLEAISNRNLYEFVKGILPDYEIKEYISFVENPIEDTWDAVHEMYRIEWINSTKTIVYDNRSKSNYTKYGAQNTIQPYQGLPVRYNEKDGTRKLYPYFDKNEQLDGNPFFQMNGGWLSKKLTSDKTLDNAYNFQFDVDDNIVYSDPTGDRLYKETIRNVKKVDTIGELINTPMDSLTNGTVYYVTNVESDIAIIDNSVHKIYQEYYATNGKTVQYVSLVKQGNFIKVGDDRIFDETIMVYDIDGVERTYMLIDKEDGYEVKAYIKDGKDFICKENKEGYYGIDSFATISTETGYTNYFVIDDIYYSNMIYTTDSPYGWRRLKETDTEYVRINTVTNYYEGNNPHTGNMVYDNGHEYFTYFSRLFKYALDNELFDERCYENFLFDKETEIETYGFSGLISSDESITYYDNFIQEDPKIYYFDKYYKKSDTASGSTFCTNTWNERTEAHTTNITGLGIIDNAYNLDEIGGRLITNQIVNNKRISINFFLHNKWYEKEGQCELKYIDDIVMNYLTQLIPSTAIVEVGYSMCPYELPEDDGTITIPNPKKDTTPNWEIYRDECVLEFYTSGAARKTGKVTVYEMDMNRYSPTYRQTRSKTYSKSDYESVFKTPFPSSCNEETVDPTPNWVKENASCELKKYEPSGVYGKTGKVKYYKVDKNPYSSSFNTPIEETVDYTDALGEELGLDCNKPNTDPEWTTTYRCGFTIQPNGQKTANGKLVEVSADTNVYSSSYGSSTEKEYTKEECEKNGLIDIYNEYSCDAPSTEPKYKLDLNTAPYCSTQDINGMIVYDGKVVVTSVDTNSLSETYGKTTTSTITMTEYNENEEYEELRDKFGELKCAAPSTDPVYEIVSGYCSGGSYVVVKKDTNVLSDTYGETIEDFDPDNDDKCHTCCFGTITSDTSTCYDLIEKYEFQKSKNTIKRFTVRILSSLDDVFEEFDCTKCPEGFSYEIADTDVFGWPQADLIRNVNFTVELCNEEKTDKVYEFEFTQKSGKKCYATFTQEAYDANTNYCDNIDDYRFGLNTDKNELPKNLNDNIDYTIEAGMSNDYELWVYSDDGERSPVKSISWKYDIYEEEVLVSSNNSLIIDYQNADSAAYVNKVSVNEGLAPHFKVTVYLNENKNNPQKDRNIKIVFKQDNSGKELKLELLQKPAIDYSNFVFALRKTTTDSDANMLVMNELSAFGESVSFYVISHDGNGNEVGFTVTEKPNFIDDVNSGSYNSTINGYQATLALYSNTNTNNNEGKIVLTQNGSNKTVELKLTQLTMNSQRFGLNTQGRMKPFYKDLDVEFDYGYAGAKLLFLSSANEWGDYTYEFAAYNGDGVEIAFKGNNSSAENYVNTKNFMINRVSYPSFYAYEIRVGPQDVNNTDNVIEETIEFIQYKHKIGEKVLIKEPSGEKCWLHIKQKTNTPDVPDIPSTPGEFVISGDYGSNFTNDLDVTFPSTLGGYELLLKSRIPNNSYLVLFDLYYIDGENEKEITIKYEHEEETRSKHFCFHIVTSPSQDMWRVTISPLVENTSNSAIEETVKFKQVVKTIYDPTNGDKWFNQGYDKTGREIILHLVQKGEGNS